MQNDHFLNIIMLDYYYYDAITCKQQFNVAAGQVVAK